MDDLIKTVKGSIKVTAASEEDLQRFVPKFNSNKEVKPTQKTLVISKKTTR